MHLLEYNYEKARNKRAEIEEKFREIAIAYYREAFSITEENPMGKKHVNKLPKREVVDGNFSLTLMASGSNEVIFAVSDGEIKYAASYNNSRQEIAMLAHAIYCVIHREFKCF